MESDKRHPDENGRDVPPVEEFLRDSFGFSEFLPYQKHIIEMALRGEDLLAVLPTGSGKSLCFQMPALMREGLTIVVSPLIALMKDQIDALRLRDLPVGCLHSSLSPAEASGVLDDIRGRRLKMIYISPERLRDGFFVDAVLAGAHTPHLWVVDEAHCITEWGHDFRTDYLYIADAVERLSAGAQMLMFTATATPTVREDILRQMRRESARVICGDFDRPNLYLGCRRTPTKSDKFRTLAELLRRPGPGIIYTATRRQCEDVNRFLQELGRNSEYYHAGRVSATRAEVHDRFLADDIDVIVATNAFGMGVDKPDIRFIIHYSHPGSIDAYYQEIGRGGRDGGRCDCILLFSRYDRKVQEQFILNATPAADAVEDCFGEIMRSADRNNGISLSRQYHEVRGTELFEMEKAGLLDRCPVMCGSATIYLSTEFEKALQKCAPRQMLYLEAIDRIYGLSSSGYAEVDVIELRRRCFPETDIFELEQALLQMNGRGLIIYRPNDRRICYDVHADEVGERAWRRIERSSTARRGFKMKRLNMMVEYGGLHSCRRGFLLDALDDTDTGTGCGFCDNCI